MTIRQQIEDFHHFALQHADDIDDDRSLDDLYRIRRARTPSGEEFHQSVAALRTAHSDLETGDAGQPARKSLRDACQSLD